MAGGVEDPGPGIERADRAETRAERQERLWNFRPADRDPRPTDELTDEEIFAEARENVRRSGRPADFVQRPDPVQEWQERRREAQANGEQVSAADLVREVNERLRAERAEGESSDPIGSDRLDHDDSVTDERPACGPVAVERSGATDETGTDQSVDQPDRLSEVDRPASSALVARDLGIALAKESQRTGPGLPIAGAGTDTPLRDVDRLVGQYGGNPSEWAKMSSTSYTDREGVPVETHWYEFTPTGTRVEFKDKYQKDQGVERNGS